MCSAAPAMRSSAETPLAGPGAAIPVSLPRDVAKTFDVPLQRQTGPP